MKFKYDITQEKPSQAIIKIDNDQNIIAISQTEDKILICRQKYGLLRLQEYSKNNLTQSLQLNRSFLTKLKQDNGEKLLNVQKMHFDDQACFLVTSDPIQLFFATQKTPEIIKIHLEKQIELVQPVFYFKDDFLHIYGHSTQQFKNYVYQINLQTFHTKIVCQGKKYAPNGRSQCVSIFLDDRLYVFGGRNKKNNIVDNLLWTFDFQKGYWFALQLKLQAQQIYNCRTKQQFYQPGKCILVAQSKLFMVELYQSRCSQIQKQKQPLKANDDYRTFVINKKVHFLNKKGQLLQKITIKAQK